jgi:hypothetical protein
MEKAHPVTSPMEIRSLDRDKHMLRKRSDNESLIGPEKPYLSAIGAIMYLANQTRHDFIFL